MISFSDVELDRLQEAASHVAPDQRAHLLELTAAFMRLKGFDRRVDVFETALALALRHVSLTNGGLGDAGTAYR